MSKFVKFFIMFGGGRQKASKPKSRNGERRGKMTSCEEGRKCRLQTRVGELEEEPNARKSSIV